MTALNMKHLLSLFWANFFLAEKLSNTHDCSKAAVELPDPRIDLARQRDVLSYPPLYAGAAHNQFYRSRHPNDSCNRYILKCRGMGNLGPTCRPRLSLDWDSRLD